MDVCFFLVKVYGRNIDPTFDPLRTDVPDLEQNF